MNPQDVKGSKNNKNISMKWWADSALLNMLRRKPLVSNSGLSAIDLSIIFFIVEIIMFIVGIFFAFGDLGSPLTILVIINLLFLIIYIPGSTFFVVKHFKHIKKFKEVNGKNYTFDLLAATAYYCIFSIFIPVRITFAQFEDKFGVFTFAFDVFSTSDLIPWLNQYVVLFIIFSLSTFIFWSMIQVNKKRLFALSVITLIVIFFSLLPKMLDVYTQNTLDPMVKNFVNLQSSGNVQRTDILFSIPDKNIVIFQSRVGYSFNNKDISYTTFIRGLKYGDKIGWLSKSQMNRIILAPLYDFDASDGYLYSPEFLHLLESNDNTEHYVYREIKELMASDLDMSY